VNYVSEKWGPAFSIIFFLFEGEVLISNLPESAIVEMLISIKPVRFISLTGGVLTLPCLTPLCDALQAGLIGTLLYSKSLGTIPIELQGLMHTPNTTAHGMLN
jgi:hypothetical protein